MKAMKWMLLFFIVPIAAWAIDTERVELRDGGENDGAVSIHRDGDDLVLEDAANGAVTLSTLLGNVSDHGALGGLSDDDHTQYLNASRHTSAHSSAYNAALAIPTDAGGNSTLGAHVQDTAIHLKRGASEAVSGAWSFTSPIEFSGGSVRVRASSSSANSTLHLGTSGSSGALTWHPTTSVLDLPGTASAESLLGETIEGEVVRVQTSLVGNPSGTRTASLSGFTTIEGIAWDELLARSENESITGSWGFVAPTEVNLTESNESAERRALRVEMNATLDPASALADRRRTGVDARLTLTAPTEEPVSGFGGVALRGEATVVSDTTADAEGVMAGVAGIASVAGSGAFGAIGAAGIADSSSGGTRRVGVLGALDADVLTDRESLPGGDHAGVFLGDALVRGALMTEAQRWTDRSALGSAGFANEWTAANDGLYTDIDNVFAYFSLPVEAGSTISAVRIKWTGAEADAVRVRLLKRVESDTTESFAVVGTEQFYYSEGSTRLDEYELPMEEVVAEGTSYTLEVYSMVEAMAVTVYSWGWRTETRVY